VAIPVGAARADIAQPKPVPGVIGPPSTPAPTTPPPTTPAPTEEGTAKKDALKKLGVEVDTQIGAADQAKRDLFLAVAQQVETGNVDPSALGNQIEAVKKACASAAPVLRHA